MAEKNYLTKEGLKKLKEELNHLRKEIRGEIAAKIKEARDMGDVLENTVYDAAIEEKGNVEVRISQLENLISNAEIVDSPNSKDEVTVGSTVIVDFSGRKDTFKIVGSAESDPVNKLISNESPVGQALLGSKKGEIVNVKTPVFTVKYKVLDIK
jgi:transcription elongation factor GreA